MAGKYQTTFLAGMKETKTGYEDLFWEVDKDRSGTLSMDELAELLQRNGYRMSKAQLQAKFSSMDSNNDGIVSYDEYLKAMGAVEAVIHRQAFFRRKFKRYDKNGDGVITPDEMESVLRGIGVSANVAYAKEVFSQCDKDGTGQIEYEEFIKFFCTGDR